MIRVSHGTVFVENTSIGAKFNPMEATVMLDFQHGQYMQLPVMPIAHIIDAVLPDQAHLFVGRCPRSMVRQIRIECPKQKDAHCSLTGENVSVMGSRIHDKCPLPFTSKPL